MAGITNKHMKRYPNSLIFRDIQTKMRYYFISLEHKIRKVIIPNAGKDVQK